MCIMQIFSGLDKWDLFLQLQLSKGLTLCPLHSDRNPSETEVVCTRELGKTGLDAKWTVSPLKEAAIMACIFLLCSRRLWRLLVKSHYARLDFLKMCTVQSYRRMCTKDSLFSMVVYLKFLSVQCPLCSSEALRLTSGLNKCGRFRLHSVTIGTLLHGFPLCIVGRLLAL